ncbi:MAG: energy-coupling factor ABC transporter permease [Proteobacteria bacterium]|nr:energy-coupling factor ABC transporter permease [Pseudomonadota bacterium]MBU4469758.1 energy-coupling factor ABC transporter permease [Pseudomonadota bacterium]MCG2753862.1 energy-coupling factor ABC transporter permease [Desulfobacteraceae bacterium]
MHMADALISPAVGGVMWAATAGLIAFSSKKIKQELDDRKVPLMGVLGAFIFAAQMINFTIPATGSSGHLGGGMILAILLGPHAAFLVMASVLTVQAFFFADGGLLALGCNIFNLGFFPCFVAYPLIFKRMVKGHESQGRILISAMVAAVIGLQLGAFSVVLETLFSGISALPFGTFVLLMQPIHLAIGIVEGLVTAAVVGFVWKARPEMVTAPEKAPEEKSSLRTILIGLSITAILTGGGLSWFASSNPDGLEWAMFKTSGSEELENSGKVHESLAHIQEKTAFLPDYGFKSGGTDQEANEESRETWPEVNSGTSVAGFVGGVLTLLLAVIIGFALKRLGKKKNHAAQ